jgi:hypothetical protein
MWRAFQNCEAAILRRALSISLLNAFARLSHCAWRSNEGSQRRCSSEYSESRFETRLICHACPGSADARLSLRYAVPGLRFCESKVAIILCNTPMVVVPLFQCIQVRLLARVC